MVSLWFVWGIFFLEVGANFNNQLDLTHPTNLLDPQQKIKTPMHKVVMTQRGYIQFLRWTLPVPEMREWTFCLWMKSDNLTYAHSLFSYSRNESERLIRSWISPEGRSVHLEIAGASIFTLRTYIAENQWHHICQSWDNAEGRYAMWIDARIVIQGLAPQMKGYVIPRNGDIVVGQEYTDFDKGLEDGIEGAVLGFNLLLASAFSTPKLKVDFPPPFLAHQENVEFGAKLEPPPLWQDNNVRRSARQIKKRAEKPLGLQLVETGFNHCEIGRGSPYIGGTKMLISWSRTPVRVFGGAILKNVNEDCGLFTPI